MWNEYINIKNKVKWEENSLEWRVKRIGIDIFLIICLMVSSIMINRNIQVFSEDYDAEPIYSVDTDEKVVSLTFDVNWAEKDNLPRILDVLDKYNIKGTFFVIGKWVNDSEENSDKLKRLSERGHEIGNHSYIHPMFTKINDSRIQDELKKTDEIIEKYTGEKTKLFRFPSGDYNKECLKRVRNLGYMAIQWNVDSVDWKELGADVEYNRVMKGVKPGSIILFHNNAKYTPDNLDRIIKELKDQGYAFKPVGEMIYYENYFVDKDGRQHKKN